MRGLMSSRRGFLGLALLSFVGLFGCEDSGKTSAKFARTHAEFVATAATKDVGEVRRGLPAGAKALEALFKEAAPETPAAVDAREALIRVRSKNNDLDSAKSTFFLIAEIGGRIIRNNLDEDDMAEKDLFEAYKEAKAVSKKPYGEFVGEWELARGVNNRPDAQWVATAQIDGPEGEPAGLLVAGWSWSSYAYRLEMALRSDILGETKEGEKVPLTYVYVVVGDQAYGAPVSPVVNGKTIIDQKPLEKAKNGEVWSTALEITHRDFGLAVKKIPELGNNVAIAVLRSET